MKTILAIDRLIIVILLGIFIQSEQRNVSAQQPSREGLAPSVKIMGMQTIDLPIKLEILALDIKILGNIAVTTFDMTFVNPNSRLMEGEFIFPLANGQSISGFALDIGGKMREGVIVDKQKGRTTFEAIARKKADPGLLEMTTGNNFRARIYPLPAKGYRRIVISCEQELSGDDNFNFYRLPLMITEPVGKFSLHAEVIKNNVKPAQDNQVQNIRFKQWNDSYTAEFGEENFTPDKMISFTIPKDVKRPIVLTAHRDEKSDWFYLNINPDVVHREKKLPETITLLWDNSNSALSRDIEKELDLLDKYIQMISNVSIDLIPFNIKTERVRTFHVNSGNWTSLRGEINQLIYDGGTSISAIDFSKFSSDEIILFSDGLSTYGNYKNVETDIPVFTVNSSLSANHALLNGIAQKSGGAYIDLSAAGVDESVEKLQYLNCRFISAIIEDGNISDVFPAGSCNVDRNFSLSGIMNGNSARLVINFGFGKGIISSSTVVINKEFGSDEKLIRRLWAEKKIAELSLDEENNRQEIISTAKEFGIVTQNTSLIVLETLEDYLLYKIVPPGELLARYNERLEKESMNNKENFEQHFNYVLESFNKQSDWWNTIFPMKQIQEIVTDTAAVEEEILLHAVAVEEDAIVWNQAVAMDIVMDAEDVSVPPPPPPPPASDGEEGLARNNMSRKEVRDSHSGGLIHVHAWDPETPYLKVLEYAARGEEYKTYLKLKKEFGTIPSFYSDAADFFSSKGEIDKAIRILSNLAELKLEVPQLLRLLGNKLMLLKQYEAATGVFKKVLEMKGEEPQSYRDLGLAYEAAGDLNKAVQTLYEVVEKDWNGRFRGIEIIVMNEINRILAISKPVDCTFIDKRLIKSEPVDIRIVLTWDTDNCDMDLWVTDPGGEKCYYQNTVTYSGGKISHDFTQGYGPEEYMIRNARPGVYKVHVNYYGTSSQALLAPVNLHVSFFTKYGTVDENREDVVLRLTNVNDVLEVGSFNFLADPL